MNRPVLRLLLASLAIGAGPGVRILRAQEDPQAARDTLRVVAVGDLNFGRAVARDYLLVGRGSELLAAVRDHLRAADIAIGNLESMILDRGDYSDPPGSPVFAGPPHALELLQDAGFDVLGTANNHAWDFGRDGLVESLGHLDRAGLSYTGTGPTLDHAYRPVILDRRGWRVAVFAVTSIFNHETMTVIGTPAECCVAWADTLRLQRLFRAARDSLGADLVLVSWHQGLEYRPVPRREEITIGRALVRAGADAVIGHHPHVPQGIETYRGAPIIYSLGNFVFRQLRPWTDRGLWAELVFEPDAGRRVVLRPLAVGYAPSFLAGADSAAVLSHVDSISERLHRSLPPRSPRGNVARPRNR
jgi:poly-gamma-glutamate synthesis protein (capsule biosynthesis protein)